jgi:hypothetical protein
VNGRLPNCRTILAIPSARPIRGAVLQFVVARLSAHSTTVSARKTNPAGSSWPIAFAARHDERDAPAHHVGCHCRQPVDLILRPTVFDPDAIPDYLRAIPPRPEGGRLRRRGHRSDWLPMNPTTGMAGRCARAIRPRRRFADQSDQLAPANHSITSSARASNGSGNERPNVLAVLILSTSSILTACWTGRSVGLSPFSTRAT